MLSFSFSLSPIPSPSSTVVPLALLHILLAHHRSRPSTVFRSSLQPVFLSFRINCPLCIIIAKSPFLIHISRSPVNFRRTTDSGPRLTTCGPLPLTKASSSPTTPWSEQPAPGNRQKAHRKSFSPSQIIFEHRGESPCSLLPLTTVFVFLFWPPKLLSHVVTSL